MPHSKTCISGNSFLEGNFPGGILLVDLLKKKVWGIMSKVSLSVR